MLLVLVLLYRYYTHFCQVNFIQMCRWVCMYIVCIYIYYIKGTEHMYYINTHLYIYIILVIRMRYVTHMYICLIRLILCIIQKLSKESKPSCLYVQDVNAKISRTPTTNTHQRINIVLRPCQTLSWHRKYLYSTQILETVTRTSD